MLTQLMVLAAVAAALGAQSASTDAESPREAPVAVKASKDEKTESARPRGDTLTLKSGQKIEGLQILRETPAYYVMQVIPGVTLDVPRGLVVKVDPDNYDPSKSARTAEQDLIQAQRISEALQRKLDIVISEPPLEYEKADLTRILEDVNKRVEGVIMVDDSVMALPPESRLWTVKITGRTTLGAFLRKDLLAQFPNLVLLFQGDKVVVSTKPLRPPSSGGLEPQQSPPANAR